jgi:hypothetical protein
VVSTDSLNYHGLLSFGIGTGLDRQHLSHVHCSLYPLINKDHDSGRMRGLAAQEQHVKEPREPLVEMKGAAEDVEDRRHAEQGDPEERRDRQKEFRPSTIIKMIRAAPATPVRGSWRRTVRPPLFATRLPS